MKRTIMAIASAILLGMATLSSTTYADEWGERGEHGYRHEEWHGHPHHHHGPPPWAQGYYAPPPAYYQAPPPPPVMYREAPAYREPHGRISELVPMAAGGIIGGVVGDQAGYGNPAAVIGGSVLGTVLGHEIAR